ncbi:DUF6878 family protein [Arvimicrobium flavum]|uniref:DUF6878 family protein n=1 Tax=Arvimicrobium flavum TaxID=3393320 RepID=UPI00237C1084|nr:DUF6878 family protein [Mesorhizobium shangrilense]
MTDAHDRQLQRFLTSLALCRPLNRDIIFDALAECGIDQVTVAFDGHDNRTSLSSRARRGSIDLVRVPDVTVDFYAVVSVAEYPIAAHRPLADAIDGFAYDALSEFHIGWQDGPGARGTVRLDVLQRRASMTFTARQPGTHPVTTNL